MTSKFGADEKAAITRISGLVLINTMVFQEILSDHINGVQPLHTLLSETNPKTALFDHWQSILEINYYPIFHLASNVLLTMSAGADTIMGLRELGKAAQDIVANRAALRHDLMGRVYHRLLADRKYLATYYTGIPSAVMLLKLALTPRAWDIEWDDVEALRRFQVGDLACGTGTLLMAAADTITDNYVASSAAKGKAVNIPEMHAALAEDMLYGYDVLVSAVHLTASTLALREPDARFRKMNLSYLPLGADAQISCLGSIEFLRSERPLLRLSDFSAPTKMNSHGEEAAPAAYLPPLDLCVMNPPFTRSVGGNLLFGSAAPKDRARMQKDLKKLVKQGNVSASITAGLGSVFAAIADRYLKDSGRLALVLPKAVLSGVAWDRTRELFRRGYQLEYIVASHDPRRWNFSESTNLSEVLLVARKVNNRNHDNTARVTAVNLWENPTISFDALAVVTGVLRGDAADVAEGQGALDVGVGKKKCGEALSIPWGTLKAHYSWLLPCGFAQSELVRTAYWLMHNRLRIPGRKELTPIPLAPLQDIATLGPDARDIHDAFKPVKMTTAYPTFWNHDATAVLSLQQKPNRHLAPLPSAKKGRHLRKVEDLWPLAGSILMVERMRLNTARLAAIRLDTPVLSNVWWPVSLKDGHNIVQSAKVLVLWLNSTLGVLLLAASREETMGAWMKFKKPLLARLPVLHAALLPARCRRQLAADYDRLANEVLQPFPQMADDPIRAQIDDAIAKALDLPDFSVLRTLLAQEPIVSLKPL